MRIHGSRITWNRLSLTRLCLESLLRLPPSGYSLTIVDNGSSDGTRQHLEAVAGRNAHIPKYLPAGNNGRYGFVMNPEYRPVQKLMQQLVQTVQVDASGRLTKVDLSRWKENRK